MLRKKRWPMVDLLSLQKAFLENYATASSFQKHIKINGTSPQNRLSVYQGNVEGAFQKALEGSYPLTWELIGQKCAAGAANTFVRALRTYPHEGTLLNWGEDFPNFLRTFEPTKGVAYLPDFARFEWLTWQSLCAEEKSPLSSETLKNINPAHYADLIFSLSPSVFLFESTYPLDQIMEVLEGRREKVKLAKRGAFLLITRFMGRVHLHWLSEADFHFFVLVSKERSLGEILENMEEKAFDFQEILSFSLKNGVFSGYAFASE